MPSPKAILRDIHDLNLNPRKAHRVTDYTGRLKTTQLRVEPAETVLEAFEEAETVSELEPVVLAVQEETHVSVSVASSEPEPVSEPVVTQQVEEPAKVIEVDQTLEAEEKHQTEEPTVEVQDLQPAEPTTVVKAETLDPAKQPRGKKKQKAETPPNVS